MKGGRKNLKKAAEEHRVVALEDGHTIMQFISLRGSNIIEVMFPTLGAVLSSMKAEKRRRLNQRQEIRLAKGVFVEQLHIEKLSRTTRVTMMGFRH